MRDVGFDTIMRESTRCLNARDGYRVFECYIDGMLAKVKNGGDSIGATRAGKDLKFIEPADAGDVPIVIETMSASPHDSQIVQSLSIL